MGTSNDVQRVEYNVYCDESCHLEHDKQPIMVLGGIWCPKAEVKNISKQIRSIKNKHDARGETKWVKVSKSKQLYYEELIDYFFNMPHLHFRCLVVKDKSELNHDYFNLGSHDTFFYKMYYSMLKTILSPENKYYIYLDIKDTRSQNKVDKLKDVLSNDVYDFTRQMIVNIQQIRSHESELLQLADLLIGAVSYRNRNLRDNSTKVLIVDKIEKKIGHNLVFSTSLFKEKFNLFIFSPTKI